MGVGSGVGPHPLVGQDFGKKLLNVNVLSTSDDGSDDFDFDADLSRGIDGGFHPGILSDSYSFAKPSSVIFQTFVVYFEHRVPPSPHAVWRLIEDTHAATFDKPG